MSFKDVFLGGSFVLDLKSDTKEGIIQELVDQLVADGKIKDRAAALHSILEREKRMSTGMQHGIAVPHGKTLSVDDLVVAFGIKKEGVAFGALDGQPSRIFIMTISSALKTGPHMQYLSEISKLLNSALVRTRLLEATSMDEVVRLIVGSAAS